MELGKNLPDGLAIRDFSGTNADFVEIIHFSLHACLVLIQAASMMRNAVY